MINKRYSFILKLATIFIIGCSYANKDDRPPYTERVFKVEIPITETGVEIGNTCLADCLDDLENCPAGIGKGGTIPTISWTEPHPDVAQYAIIMESDESHRAENPANGTFWGCWPGEITDVTGTRSTNCTHAVIYQIPREITTVDSNYPTPGVPIISTEAAYGNSLTSYTIANQPDPNNIGRRYNGPCPPGFFYPNYTYTLLTSNSPPGTYTYTLVIYALNLTGVDLSKNTSNNLAYTHKSMQEIWKDVILEQAEIKFTYEFVK